MKTCKKCSFENRDDASFCSNCGSGLDESLIGPSGSVDVQKDYFHLKANRKIAEENSCTICHKNFYIGDDILRSEKKTHYYHQKCWEENKGYDQPEHQAGEETKLCLFCGGEIKLTAIKCRHCGTILDKTLEDHYGPKENAKGAVASLVCAIIGLFLFGFILGAVAIGQGNKAVKRIEEDPKLKGKGMANAGIVIGVIDIIFWVIAIIIKFSI